MVYSKCDQKSSDYCNASLVWFGHGKIDRQWSENIPETKSSDYCNILLVWFGHGKIDR